MTHELGMPTPQFIYADYDANPAPWLETLLFILGKRRFCRQQVTQPSSSIGGKSPYLLVMEDIHDGRLGQIEGGSIDDASS